MVAAESALLREAGHEVAEHHVPNPTGALKAATALAAAPWNPRRGAELRQVALSHRPDVVHLHNTWFALTPAVIRALRRTGIPIVATVHNYRLVCANALLFRDGRPCRDCVGRSPWPGVVHRCYRNSTIASTAAAVTIAVNRPVWADVDVLCTLTEFAREQLVASGLPAEKIIVKPNFVADPGPRPKPPSASDTVVFAGRLSVEKGVDTLLRAWSRSPQSRTLRLQILGDGPLRAELRSLASDSVDFAGHLPHADVLAAMRSARAVVFPSVSYENQPLTVLEAFASGVPLLGSATPGNREVLATAGQRGWLVAPGDVDDWARAFDVLGDDEAVDAAGCGGRMLYEERYAPAVALRSLLALYQRAMAG